MAHRRSREELFFAAGGGLLVGTVGLLVSYTRRSLTWKWPFMGLALVIALFIGGAFVVDMGQVPPVCGSSGETRC